MRAEMHAGGVMRHCCSFNPTDIYYLKENEIYHSRTLSIGFCPICGKPVCELAQWRFDGIPDKKSFAGIFANDIVIELSDEIDYSMREVNYRKFKSKPYGWRYGVNKSYLNKKTGEEKISQYACDFYGGKELVKVV